MIAHIFEEDCTGCGACVPACPTHVLDPGQNGVPVVARPDQCQTCFMCELYCDADAIYVAPDQHGPEAVDVTSIRASGELGSLRRAYRWHGGHSEPGSLDQFWQLGPLLREGAEIAAQRYRERHRGPASG
jgi:NAD-dependent dihydropyrimidine dehydrogenase PreA subunit